MATHSNVLAWRIPGMVEPGVLPSMGLHRIGHDWSDLAAAVAARCFMIWSRPDLYSCCHPPLPAPCPPTKLDYLHFPDFQALTLWAFASIGPPAWLIVIFLDHLQENLLTLQGWFMLDSIHLLSPIPWTLIIIFTYKLACSQHPALCLVCRGGSVSIKPQCEPLEVPTAPCTYSLENSIH